MDKKAFNIRKLTLCAVLTAAALALSLFERAIPLGLLVPLPGIKLGLSNVVTLMALLTVGTAPAAVILALRVFILYFMTGSITGLAMSACGGALAFLTMAVAKGLRGKHFSVYGVSVCGACAHNLGQIACAMALMHSTSVIYYLPLLLITGCITGVLTAAITAGVVYGIKGI